MAESRLPRLLYIADVPVEASQHGSALMFRALEAYPADHLMIVETGAPSDTSRRLAGVSYHHLPAARRRLLNSRLHGWYSAWLTERAPARAADIARLLGAFVPEAVITVGHGFGWITAAAAAARFVVPLHFIVHDDWPRLSAIARPWRDRLDRLFGESYRGAANRLCVSPFMAERYRQRYGALGTVMYPSRSLSCPVFDAQTVRDLSADAVIAYAGNSGPEMMACLRSLAAALPGSGWRLEVFGSFDDAQQRQLTALSTAITFNGFMRFDRMVVDLRDRADVLFVPMTFEPDARENMTVSFPSKLTDYTATGIPLLIYGPEYSSAVKWARSYDPVAEVVADPEPAALTQALARLRADRSRRQHLAERAVDIGGNCFGPATARNVLYDALRSAHRP